MKKIFFFSAIVLVLLVSIFYCFYFKTEKNSLDGVSSNNYHYAFYSDKGYYGGLESIAPENNISEKIYGGIVSHHFFVAKEIAQFFVNLKNQKPEVVVVIGPNHYNLGRNILVSKYSYKTPWGILEPDEKRIEELLNNNILENDEFPFETEHSISALVGFIKYVFPRTKIIPIIIRTNTPQEKVNALVEELNNILPENSLVLASSDFSHYQTREVSKFHDEKTISAIKSFSYDQIYGLEIDSSPSILTLLKYLEKRSAQKISYKSVNSADFTGNLGLDDVTSYLFAYFTKGLAEKEEKISILSFGDMMFDRGVKTIINLGKDPFEYIRGKEDRFLMGIDFIMANLEGAITEQNNCQDKPYVFKFKPDVTKVLLKNKFDVLNLSNNHSYDCGKQGLEDTKKYLDESKINYFGGGSNIDDSYIIKKVGDKTIAFVGIDQTTNPIDIGKFYLLVEKLKNENNYVVVNIHWGYEYDVLNSKIQTETAYKLIDSGADIILGHHPHVIQPVEIYKNKPIFYSLGNFVFDQLTKETNEGIGVGTVFGDIGQDIFIFPYQIIKGQPKLLPYDQMVNFCKSFLIKVKENEPCVFNLPNN